LRRLHLLVVDDDPHIQNRMTQALEGEFSIQYVASVSEAYESLSLTPLPDMLITEVYVESNSGLDLCRYIRNTPVLRNIPVMFLTTRATILDKVSGFQAGADDYVVKPFDDRHLKARIRLLARIKRLEHRDSA
jgi:Response regulators consisting of a CheY-like receiver domain and a winged-helix DNA-binding domain